MTDAFKALLEKRKELEARVREANSLLAAVDTAVESTCTHENVRTTYQNFEGGYDYKAEYHTVNTCRWCHKELSRDIKYGSFA
jgi:hypothetical protein